MIPRDVLLGQLHRDFPIHVPDRVDDYLPVGENYTGSDDPAEVRASAEVVWAALHAVASRLSDMWGPNPADADDEVMFLAGHLLDTLAPEVRLGIYPLCLEEYIRYGTYELCDISLNHLAIDFLQRGLLTTQQQATLLEIWCWLCETGELVFDVPFAWAFRIANPGLIRPETSRFIIDRYAEAFREKAVTFRLFGGHFIRVHQVLRPLLDWVRGAKPRMWETDLKRVATMDDREISDWFRGVYVWFGPGTCADEPPSLETLAPESTRDCVRQICERAGG